MPTNEFEKQVQKQLDDFQLNPSASVWKKVEEEITRKKRRRIVFFLLLPLAIGLLGYMGYQFLYTSPKTELAKQPAATKNETSITTGKNNTSSTIKETPLAIPPQKTNETGEVNKENIAVQKKNRLSQKNNLQVLQGDALITHGRNKRPVETDVQNGNIKKQEPLAVITNDVSSKQDIAVTVENPQTGTNPKNEVSKNSIPGKNDQNDKVILSGQDVALVKTDSIKKDEVSPESSKEAITKNKKDRPRLTWGIDLSAGIVANNDQAFSFNKSYPAADALYSSPGTGGSTGSPPPIIPSSPIKPGSSFRVGLTAELQVSERSRFSTGLEYVYASNHIKTGIRTDTVILLQAASNNFINMQVNRVYRGIQQNDHTNRYHFIQIPLWYHWQVNKGKKLPVQWNIGVAVSYLVATNALVYDTRLGGIYYPNKDAFNKTHFNLGTGFSLRLKGKKNMEWVLGPEISFDLSKLMINAYDKKEYLLFGGINAKLFFPKKKSK